MNSPAAIAALFLLCAASLAAQQPAHGARPARAPRAAAVPAVAPAEVARLLGALADDSLEGRDTGSRGSAAAARIIAAELRAAGAWPAGDSGYFQRVPVARTTVTAQGRTRTRIVLLPDLAAADTLTAASRLPVVAVNVVGVLPGRDPQLRGEAVVVSAHYDHLGIGQPVNGDSIRNGAVDNASGVATMLAIADAFTRSGLRPKRTLIFVGMALEESGLLGSAWLAAHPPVPPAKVAADLNLDVTNLFGATRDISAVGADQSTLGRFFEAAARAERLRVVVDSVALSHGSFFRADHFSFAKAGVPAMTPGNSYDFVGKPAGWGRQQKDIYDRERYHQPADNLLSWYTVDGAVQQARVLALVAWNVAEAVGQPSWYPTSEFAVAGRQRIAR